MNIIYVIGQNNINKGGIKMDINTNKRKIIDLLSTVEREGMKELIDYLETRTDFFVAPASSKYHGNYPRCII